MKADMQKGILLRKWGREAAATLMALLLVLACFPSLSALAATQDGNTSIKTVRIGCVSLNGFFTHEDDHYSGVGYEMLQEVSMYTGWRYEFVSAPLEDLLSMLQSGEIDLMTPIQKTDARQEIYEYSAEPLCSNQAAVVARSSSTYCYDDYTSFNGMTIGSVSGNYNNERLQTKLAENGCSVNLVDTYPTVDALWDALADENSGVDAILISSCRSLSNCKVIANLDSVSSYVIANKGNRSCMDELDSALSQIDFSNPYLRDSLESKYRISGGGMMPSYTREEQNYIDRKKTVRMIFNSSCYDVNSKTLTEPTSTLVSSLEQRTGLTIEPVLVENLDDEHDKTRAGEGDILYPIMRDYQWGEACNVSLTKAFATRNSRIVSRVSTTDIKRIAIVRSSYYDFISSSLSYTNNAEIVYCDNYEEAFNLMVDGKADAAYTDGISYDYYSTIPKYSNFISTTLSDAADEYSMGIVHGSDTELISIINKAIDCFSPDEASAISNPSVHAAYTWSFMDYYYVNPKAGIIIVASMIAAILLIAFLIVFLTTLRRKKRQVEAMANSKSALLSNVSHDMRTPMNAIIGMSQLALDRDDLPEGVREQLQAVRDSSDYLLDLINDTLDYNKIEAGKLLLNPTPVSVSDLLDGIEKIVGLDAEKKDIELSCSFEGDKELCVLLDRMRLEQILLNLLNNAVKFTPSKGRVEFKVKQDVASDEKVHLEFFVTDTGIGMSKEFQGRLFEPFEQESPETASNYGGTGLGLAITKRIVDIMEGTISVSSSPGEGSTFTVVLDVPSCSSKYVETGVHDEGIEETPIDLSGRLILVAEDNTINYQLLEALLDKKGCVCEQAKDGTECCQMFTESALNHYDAILMDIRMSRMSGLEAAKTIRSMERRDAQEIPIIAVTANAFDEDFSEVIDAGMNGCVVKPVSPEKLYRMLSQEIGKRTR